MSISKFEIVDFVCPECGNKFPIPRPNNKRREKGHIKDLWCPFCEKVVKMKEVKPKEIHTSMSGEIW